MMKNICSPVFLFIFLCLAGISHFLSAQNSSYDFLKAYPVKTPDVLDSVRTNDPRPTLFLTDQQKKALHLDQIFQNDSAGLASVYLAFQVKLPYSFHSIVFRYFHGENEIFSILVNYSENYQVVDQQQLSFHNDQRNNFKGEGTILKDRIIIYQHNENRTSYLFYLFAPDGKMPQRVYKSIFHLINEGSVLDQRIVSARSGLNIRDSLGNKIGKFNFADAVFILEYSKDSTMIIDEGKQIWGRKAMVILDYEEYIDHLVVPSRDFEKGYVFEGFLYKSSKHHLHSNAERPEEGHPLYYYYSTQVSVSRTNYPMASIDIKEFMEIEKVNLGDYRRKILASETLEKEKYQLGNNSQFTLNFSNGTSRTFKDTTYEHSEYSPTNYYRQIPNPKLYGYYVIYNPFFEDSHVFILDKKNGEKAYTFEDYPFVSPNRKIAISLKVPYTYDDGTAAMEVVEMNKGKFRLRVMAQFINWNIPNDRQIYWLSDREFILRVKKVEAAYSNEEDAEFFYLKFRLRE
ncbi:MAG: hypothetical protein KDE26_27425 [Bacteroidetes bacterium]|nr:hypothetical protein [Bacteroidota bacterium]MCB0847024.1 hypothetical protein [Bacteroidota bacterium]